MKTILFQCPIGGQFHFGRIALDDKTSLDDTTPIYHSDSLTSALVATAYRTFSTNLADQVLGWFKEGKICFSSLFYCLTNTVDDENCRIFFLPKPVHLDAGTFSEPKKVRDIRFISKGVWEAGYLPEDWAKKDSPCKVLQKEFVVLKSELVNIGCPKLKFNFQLYDIGAIPKVKIHQPKKEDNLYYHGNVFLSPSKSPRVNFYSIVKSELDESQWNIIFSLLEILVDEGIGGERSVGCGHLEGIKELGDFGLSVTESSSRFATMNMVSPKDAEDLNNLLAWRTATRGGRFINANDRLKRIKMVTEGAIASSEITGTYHTLLDSPTHLRFGHALNLQLPKQYAEYGSF